MKYRAVDHITRGLGTNTNAIYMRKASLTRRALELWSP